MTGWLVTGDVSSLAWSLQVSLPDLLPADFAVPDPIYWVPTALALLAMLLVLYFVGPTITDWTAAALAPWIGVGAVLHVLYQEQSFFEAVRPLFGNPMVYLTTAAVVALVWTVSEFIADMRPPGASNDRQLGAVGGGVLLALLAWSVYIVAARQFVEVRPFWPTIAFVAAALITGVGWVLISILFSSSASVAGRTGLVVLFGHTLDGVSTALAIDGPISGFTERTPLSRWVLDVGASLPTADVIGSAWLFVLVKMVLAAVVIVAFRETLRDSPGFGRMVLVFVAAVGLGPGLHNVVLFTVREWVTVVGTV
jgi:Predicted membrane protein